MHSDNVPSTNKEVPSNQSKESTKKGSIMMSNNVQLTNTEHVRTLSEYVSGKKEIIQTISKERANMNSWSRFKDGKVPEKDKAFYHFFTFKSSKQKDISGIIKTYKTFYEEMSTDFPTTQVGQIYCEDLRSKIEKIKKKMSHIYELAKNALDKTSSKVIYEMHESFIKDYEKLNWVVEAADNAALSKMLATVQTRWEEALERLTALSLEYENVSKNYTEINKKYTDISQKYDELKVSQDAMLATNQRLEAKVDEVMELLRGFIP